jgi:hypothetical protein
MQRIYLVQRKLIHCCHVFEIATMKAQRLTLILAILFLEACNKDKGKGECNTFFVITSTISPSPVTVRTGISSVLSSYGANSCFTFTNTSIKEMTGNIFEVRSNGTVHCDANVCADVLIGAQDTVHIPSPIPGTYILRFYNGSSLFKSDTVQVN